MSLSPYAACLHYFFKKMDFLLKRAGVRGEESLQCLPPGIPISERRTLTLIGTICERWLNIVTEAESDVRIKDG